MKTDTVASHDPVCYYYKDPVSGVEMNFTKSGGYGWGVSFPNAYTIEEIRESLLLKDIPWPKLSDEDQAEVDENYRKLHELMGRDDEL